MSELQNSFYESDNDSSDEVELNLYNNSDCSELESENDENDNEYESDSDNSEVISVRRKCARLLSSDSDSSIEQLQEQWIWEEKENLTDIKQFQEITGINTLCLRKLGDNPTPLKVLDQVLTEILWKIIVKETNRNASQIIAKEGANKRNLKWFPVTLDEMKGYIALCIIMFQKIKKSNLGSYWSKRTIINTSIFAATMPRDRFFNISKFLHFTDNEKLDKNDRIRKIRNLVDYLNNTFDHLFTPESAVSLDE